jgi:hypothetical protein
MRMKGAALMVTGTLSVAILVTPFTRWVAWFTALASAPVVFGLSLLTNLRAGSLGYVRLVRLMFARVALPTLVAFGLFIRGVGQLDRWFVGSGLAIVFGGTLIGSALINRIGRRDDGPRTGRLLSDTNPSSTESPIV